MEWSTFWTAVGALATVAAAYLIYLAAKQLRFEAWLRAQEVFVEEKFTDARTRVFRHLQDPNCNWDAEDQAAGLLVCRRLDEICHLAPYFALTRSGGEKVILHAWDEPIGKLWGLLEPLVTAERDKVRSQKKWKGFADLGAKALTRLSLDERHHLMSATARLSPQITRHLVGPAQSPLPPGAA